MDFKELKKLIGDNGRCVIIEGDRPAYVVLTAKEFLALQALPSIPQENNSHKLPSESLAQKEPSPSFINADDNSNVELRDIIFDDLGIDELSD